MASELRVDKIIPTSGVPATGGGGVVQVVHGTKTGEVTITTTTFQDTGVTATITPKFNTSKILVRADVHCASEAWNYGPCILKVVYAPDNSTYGDIGMPATGTHVGHMLQQLYSNGNGNTEQNASSVNWQYLHSPATTSQIGYKLQGRIQLAGSWWVNRSAAAHYAVSSITLMEVSA